MVLKIKHYGNQNVIIKVNHLTFISDFFVIDIEEDLQVPIILGRSFLRTAYVIDRCQISVIFGIKLLALIL